MEENEKSKLLRAYKKVDEIKKYRMFVVTTLFIAVCIGPLIYFLYTQNAPQMVLWLIGSPLIVFGIILFTEYIRVFDRNPLFNKTWEERKIKKFIENERIQSNNYE
ncbi:2TM domain-containing protein [Maribacter halichondriae]|uniref:2TM domain-containing protein n=1 Tax=Maribacter halichondriae TaxID=2980554 RepID=UPI0023598085|nr:2TM domain-containing protein [Maribacter sp. Hal144]